MLRQWKTKVTRAQITTLYRAFLHRDPESEEVINEFLKIDSLGTLCSTFLGSEEFTSRFGRAPPSFEWPPISVETDIDEASLAQLVNHVERVWHELGDAEPYWSVITRPEFKSDAIATNVEEFRESGLADANRFRAFASRANIDLSKFECCLELGCGVGRVTRWLIEAFSRVIAVDISLSHLAILEKELPVPSITQVHLTDPNSIRSLPEFDAFFSLIVLQHNPPPVMALLLKNILIKLRTGGIGYFQLPSYKKGDLSP